ncbi:hypothetical protein EP7_004266 [Isosphaeraceae bacterium EP7]
MTTKERTLIILRDYRAATKELLIVALGDVGAKCMEKHLLQLKQFGLVASHAYRGNAHIYYLTALGAETLGLDPKAYRRPPGEQSIAENLAIAAFCFLGQHRQSRIPRAEFRARFPQLDIGKVCASRYYVDRSDPNMTRLGILVPEYSLSSKQLAHKVRKAYTGRADNSQAWHETFARDAAQITIITAVRSKAERVRQALRNDTSKFRAITVVVPELLNLLTRRKKKPQ